MFYNSCTKTSYEFFNEGFFGYGEAGDFKPFSLAHFAPIIIMIIIIFLIYKYQDKLRKWEHEEDLRFIFAAIIIIVETSYFWRLLYVGGGGYETESPTLLNRLPFQLCEWTGFFAAFMLMKKSQNLFDIVYYIALTLGVFPLLTPAVITTSGPTYYRYYQYWLEHILPIIAVFYMLFVWGFRTKFKSLLKPAIFILILAVPAIYLNMKYPYANYLYLQANTPGESLANIFPESLYIRAPIYIAIYLILFSLIYIPMHYLKKKDHH